MNGLVINCYVVYTCVSVYFTLKSLPLHVAFLETDIPPSAAVTITCDPQSVSLSGWSHSPGTGVVTDLLDTSPSKYSTNGDTLTITNINRTDEGVYRCIYSNGNTPEQCIFVYGELIHLNTV